MLKISNKIITRVITVKYSIASPPNFIRGIITLLIKEVTTAFRLFGSPLGENLRKALYNIGRILSIIGFCPYCTSTISHF